MSDYIATLEKQNEELKQLLARSEKMCCHWIDMGNASYLVAGKKVEFFVAEIRKIDIYQSQPVVTHEKIMWTATIHSKYHAPKTEVFESKEQAMAGVERSVFGE